MESSPQLIPRAIGSRDIGTAGIHLCLLRHKKNSSLDEPTEGGGGGDGERPGALEPEQVLKVDLRGKAQTPVFPGPVDRRQRDVVGGECHVGRERSRRRDDRALGEADGGVFDGVAGGLTAAAERVGVRAAEADGGCLVVLEIGVAAAEIPPRLPPGRSRPGKTVVELLGL